MKRIAAGTFIVAYISALSIGNFCHTLNYQTGSHPLMYLVIWDMFCGWSAYASQVHVIAEGESDKYYELAPGPWGAYRPWGGDFARHSYDAFYNHIGRMAVNTLKHTEHEPIARIYVIEENWPKKYDLPEYIWKFRYGDQPRDVQTYCRLRQELDGNGQLHRGYTSWLHYVQIKQLSSNPRLQVSMQRSQPMFVIGRDKPGRALSVPELSATELAEGPVTAGVPGEDESGLGGIGGGQ